MKNLEANKFLAAILVAGIIAMLSGFVADIFTSSHGLEKNAVSIDGGSALASTGSTVKKLDLPEPMLELIATADLERGKKVSKACAACHTFTNGGRNGVGPNLWNAVNSSKQTKSGYSYSGTLNIQGGDVWTYAELNKFIYKPKKYVKGTKMNFVGMKKTADRANLVAWLRTLADDPSALPSQADIDAEKDELLPEEIVEETSEELLADELPVEEDMTTDSH